MLFQTKSRFWQIKIVKGWKTRVETWGSSYEQTVKEKFEHLQDIFLKDDERIIDIQMISEKKYRKLTNQLEGTLMVDQLHALAGHAHD